MPAGIQIEDFIKHATSFYIDSEVEEEFSSRVEGETDEIFRELGGLNDLPGLKNFIETNPKSLSLITSLLGLSEEKFKRIITMLRIQKRYSPNGDWSLSETRNQMLQSGEWMETVCKLFLQGKNLPEYQNVIPGFYLENLYLDENVLRGLNDREKIKRLVRDGLDGTYSSAVGKSFAKKIEASVKSLAGQKHFSVEKDPNVPWLSEQPNLAISKDGRLRAIVNYSYNLTTSSTQSKYARKISKTREDIEKHCPGSDREIEIITVLDGAGWIARQSDLRTIFECSDQLLNLNLLQNLEF